SGRRLKRAADGSSERPTAQASGRRVKRAADRRLSEPRANGGVPRPATGRSAAASERELTAVVVGRQLHPRDPQLALLREQRQDRGDGPFGQVKLTGEIARAHRAETLQARMHIAIDLAPPPVHNGSSDTLDLATLGAREDIDNP